MKRSVGLLLDTEVTSATPVSGGDINEAYRCELSRGCVVFVKTSATAPCGMFSAEARSLQWLAETDALKVPRVVVASDGEAGASPRFLVLEYVERGAPRRDHDERLGRGLAALHRYGTGSFGLDRDNFIGPLVQDNTPSDDWVEFYRERRLLPQLGLAKRRGLLPDRLTLRFDRVLVSLGDLVGEPEPPARLHGDLWSGNLHTTSEGEPMILDPAAYGGHREVDLAMMRLFGGFGGRVFDAYRESYPVAEGFDDRVGLYQLYPLLVHLNLFGSGYLGQIERVLGRYA